MPGSGMRVFLEPEQYETSLRHAHIDAAIAFRGAFKARLTWVDLDHLQVIRCEECVPRIAYLQLSQRVAFVTFTTHSGASPMRRGMELTPERLVFHGRGKRMHQSTPGRFVWNVMAIDPVSLEHYVRTISGRPFFWPSEGRTLQPSARNSARLRRLFAQIMRLAETKSRMLSMSAVARAFEQDLIEALVICLTTARGRPEERAGTDGYQIMTRLEEVLADRLHRPSNMAGMCERVGVSDRMLRVCCAEFLGMSPTRYLLLRRLREVRDALGDADPGTATVGEIAGRFGFGNSGHFAATYRATFGEIPSTTLRRAPGMRFVAP
jgi:AraC-like DNA-binding protein